MSTQPVDVRLRVGLYGFFGAGNIGNEASLEAVLARLRDGFPNAEIQCLGADPVRVQREHGIPGARLMAYRPASGDTGKLAAGKKALSRLVDLPRTLLLVLGVDVLVVPGTGVLENTLMSAPWGMPYWLATAFTLSRATGRPAALVCVGADPAPRRATRVLLAHIVRRASHVSYRDTSSRDAAAAMGSIGHPGAVAPDVAFDLPGPVGVEVRRGHVVIGVMTFLGAADDPGRGTGVVDTYVDRMSALVSRLLRSGRTVTLVVGDVADLGLADRLEREVRAVRPETSTAELATNPTADFRELMAEMASADVVVASRFHNVIAALKARRPVVSLSYAGKNAQLLGTFGLGAFDHPIDAFDVDQVMDDVEVLTDPEGSVGDRIERRLGQTEAEIARHLDDLLGTLVPPRVAARVRRRRRPR